MDVCRHCGSRRLIFHAQMTNVDKLRCKDCHKYTFVRGVYRNPARSRGPRARNPRVRPERLRITHEKNFTMFNHQKKGDKYVDALIKYSDLVRLPEVDDYYKLGFVLTDSDIMGRTFRLDRQRRKGCNRFFVIPHTARPNIVNDIIPRWQYTTAQFVAAQGHVDVIRAYGYDLPLHPVGWTLCPIRKFTSRERAYNILFCPIHPRCAEIDKQVNRDAFAILYKLAKAGEIHLTVRFIRSLIGSGLDQVEHPNVTYRAGAMDQAYDMIDKADVVIGHQTVAWLGVARGVPTLMMAEDMPTHIQTKSGPVQTARNWKKYQHLLAYPLDILNTSDPLGMLQRAVTTDADIIDWKNRMIGQPFQPRRFVEIVQSYL